MQVVWVHPISSFDYSIPAQSIDIIVQCLQFGWKRVDMIAIILLGFIHIFLWLFLLCCCPSVLCRAHWAFNHPLLAQLDGWTCWLPYTCYLLPLQKSQWIEKHSVIGVLLPRLSGTLPMALWPAQAQLCRGNRGYRGAERQRNGLDNFGHVALFHIPQVKCWWGTATNMTLLADVI